jgi:4-amino-4-deoxy-L-arabinose transferase-like glycosyltransferase
VRPASGLSPLWLALAAITLLRLLMAAVTPLSPDEAYYWVWSRALAPGFLDHPPMVAIWIRAGTLLAGDTDFGIRLLAPLSALAGSLMIHRAGEDLLGPGVGWRAVLLGNATLLFNLGGMSMTPDTPLLFFWTAALWALARLHRTGRPMWWLVAGIATGLAMDSKYTAILLIPATAAWVVIVPAERRWLRHPVPYVGALIAAVLFLPVLGWNASHGWASFAKQFGRAGDFNPAHAAQFIAELLAGQFGLFTPGIAVLGVAGAWAALKGAWRGSPGWALLACVTVIPALVFLEHALGDRVQANWPGVLLPGAVIAAAGLGEGWARWRMPSAALGLALTAVISVQGAFAPLSLPVRLDPLLLRLGGWPELADQVAREAQVQHADLVVADNYGVAALMARLLPPSLPVIGLDARWALFDLPDATATAAGHTGLLIRSARRHDPPTDARWSAVAAAGDLDRTRGGMVAEAFRLYRVTGAEPPLAPTASAAAVMPRPKQGYPP